MAVATDGKRRGPAPESRGRPRALSVLMPPYRSTLWDHACDLFIVRLGSGNSAMLTRLKCWHEYCVFVPLKADIAKAKWPAHNRDTFGAPFRVLEVGSFFGCLTFPQRLAG